MTYEEQLAVLSAAAVSAYWTNLDPTETHPFLGETLFPAKKKLGLRLDWLKGYNQGAVVLQPSAFDTIASVRDRIAAEIVDAEMPFFREAMRIGERDRQELLTLLDRNPQIAAPLIAKLYDDAGALVKGAHAQAERMRFDLLTTGRISLKSSDDTGRAVAYDYNYDPSGKWATANTKTLTATDLWSDAEHAKPLQEIEKMKQAIAEVSGNTPSRLLMNTVTFTNMCACESVKRSVMPVWEAGMFIPTNTIKSFVEDSLGVSIVIYDKRFIDADKKTKKYLPDGKVVFLPETTLGSTWYGTTPEEFDLANSTDANVSVVDTGVAITTLTEKHPVNVQTIVSQITLPSFEAMNNVGVLTVL